MARKKKKVELCPDCGEPFVEHESLNECFTEFTGITAPKSDADTIGIAFSHLPVKKLRQEGPHFIFQIAGVGNVVTDNPQFDILKLIMQKLEEVQETARGEAPAEVAEESEDE